MKGLFIYSFIDFGVLLVSLAPNTLVRWVKPEFETQNRKGRRLKSILCAGYFIFLSFSDTISFTTRRELQKSSKGCKRSVFVARLLLVLVYVASLWLIISYIHVITGREVRVGKTAPEVLSTPEAEGREPYSKPRPQLFLYADGPRPVNKLLFFRC